MNNPQSLYFAILAYLAPSGIAVEKDISTIVDEYFLEPKSVGALLWSERINDVLNYLNIIKNNGHIKYEQKFYETETKPGWVKPLTVTAEITQAGLDYYYSDVLRKKTIKSLGNQLAYNLITWGIAIVAISVSIYTINQNTDLSQRLVRLEREMQLLKYPQHSQTTTYKTGDTISKRH